MATYMKENATVNDDDDNTEYVPSSPQNSTACLPSEDADDYNEGVEKIVQLMEKLSINEMNALKICLPSVDADGYTEGVDKIVQLAEKLSINEMSALKILIVHTAEKVKAKDNVSNSSE